MATQERATDVQLGLYVRALVPREGRPRQMAVLRGLETLRAEDAIDDYDVVVCGRQLPASASVARTDAGVSLANDVATFREWARRNGCELRVRERTVENKITGESYRAVEWPQLLLVEYHGANLSVVTPVDTGEDVLTAEDRLAAIEAGETDTAFIPVERARESASTAKRHPSSPPS